MARLDDLIAQVTDSTLRHDLEAALADMKRRQRFGIVFEEHLPELTALYGLPAQPGALALRRDDLAARTLYRVLEIGGDGLVLVEPTDGGDPETLPVGALLVVKRFGEPMYPALTPLGAVRRGPDDKPHHAVINGENFHALQLLLYMYEGQADCIYLDPPYNTGARDWKYNNRYVDDNDSWRHSKWLSFMEKRLRLAKRLLKPEGIMVITIDDYEVHHLRLLLETKLSGCRVIGTVVIKTSPSGRPTVRGFRTNHEYAFFVAISPNANIKPLAKSEEQMALFKNEDEEGRFAWVNLRKRGGANTHRSARPKQYYPIYANGMDDIRIPKMLWDKEKRDWDIVEEPTSNEEVVFPIGDDGRERIWSLGQDTAKLNLSDLKVKRDGKGVSIMRKLRLQGETSLPSTWWDDTKYSVVEWGTGTLNKIFGTSPFPFSKSVYAVLDCLKVAGADAHDALIIDMFAGSGTTLHAACLLNEEDDGQRRCILVTNNEVAEETARRLYKESHYRGDPAFEAHGIFEQVARPRSEAVVTGCRPDGTPIPGNHINGRPFAQGFPENAEFFRLDYLDPDEVDLGRQFEAILPTLWLAAGGIGPREAPQAGQDFSLPEGAPYGVLFHESRFRPFLAALETRPDVSHVWLATDSEEAFAEMRAALPARLRVSMLYRDYLRNFRINTERNHL
jgi:adenine-specific DNA-methyltransferase